MDAFALVDVALRRGFTTAQVREALATFSDNDIARLAAIFEWSERRHDFQVTPDGDWKVWLAIAGRGSGKTRLGAEWTWQWCAAQPRMAKPARHLVTAPTASDLIDTCYEGDSGLLACIPSCLIQSYKKTPRPRIVLHNGALIGGIAAEQPARFRGPQWHRAWADEVGAWSENGRDDEYAWQMMDFSIRLGSDARILVTTTPKPRPLIRKLMEDRENVVTFATTHVNLKNLDQKFRERILKYDGTKIGRQEIYAEILNPEEGGIVSRSQLKLWPSGEPLPRFEFIVMSLDTAFSEKDRNPKKNENDPTACSVWGCFRHKGKAAAMLLDCWQEWLKFPDLVDRVKLEKGVRYGADAERPVVVVPGGPSRTSDQGHPIDLIVIEQKASGISLRQQLAKDQILTHPYNPGNADKLTRLNIVSPLFARGFVWVPESKAKPGQPMTWAEPLIEQVCSYQGEGTVLHDDLLDTTTQALRVCDDKFLHFLPKRPLRRPGIGDPPPRRKARAYG